MRILSILFAVWSLSMVYAQPLVLDKIAAQVGDNIILLSDLKIQEMQAKEAKIEIDSNFDCRMLEELMIEQVLVNQAKLDSILIADEQVDADMENRLRLIQQQMGGDRNLRSFTE